MKILALIAGILLALVFSGLSLVFLLGLFPPQPAPPAGSLQALFMGAFAPSGYLTVVKVLEVIGGLLVAVPLTRNLGLLILGPIIVNILLYHALIMKGEGLFNPIILAVAALALLLLFVERAAWLGLVRRPR